MKTNDVKSTVRLLLSLVLVFGSVVTARSAIRTWDGSSSTLWGTPANWTGGVAPVNGDDLVFPVSAARKSNYNNLGGLLVNSVRFEGGGYTLRGLGFRLVDSIEDHSNSTTLSNTIECGITLSDSIFIRVSYTTSTLAIEGNINLLAHTLLVKGRGSTTLSGLIYGTGDLQKSESGTLTLAGTTPNGYSGETRVTQGTLELRSTGNAINAGNLVIGNGFGSVDTAVVREFASYQIGNIPITINADGWLDVGNYLDSVGAITFNGGHAGSSAIGMLTLGGTVTVNAASTSAILDGRVNLRASVRTFNVANGSVWMDLRVNAILSGTAFIKTGTGVMGLYGANTHTGTTTVNEGRLYLANNNALGTTAGGTVVNGSGLLQLWSVAMGSEPLILAKTSGSSLALHTYRNSSWAGSITLAEDSSIEVGTTYSMTFSGVVSGSGGLTHNGPGDLKLSGSLPNTFTGPTLVKNGQLLLGKTGSGYPAVRYGSLTIGDGSGSIGTAVVKELGDYQIGTIPVTVNADGLLDLNNFDDTIGNHLTVNGGRGVKTGTGVLSLVSNSKIECTTANSTISGHLNIGALGTCEFDVSGCRLYLTAVMSGAAAIRVTAPTQMGYLQLSGANTFFGTLTVEDSANLFVLTDDALGSNAGGTVVNDSAVLSLRSGCSIATEPLIMNSDSSEALYASQGIYSWGGPITLARDTSVCFSDIASSLDLSGTISGVGGLIKPRSFGTLILSGSGNSYTGDTIINGGVLELANSNVIRGGTLTVGDRLGAQYSATVRFSSDHPIHSDADVVINSDGWIDFNHHSDNLGNILFDRGCITTGSGGTVGIYGDVTVIESVSTTSWTAYISGHANLSGTRVFDVDTNTKFTIAAPIGGSRGGIVKTGAGQLFLSDSNAYGGLTQIRAGSVYVDKNTSLGSTMNGTTVSSGASLILRSNAKVGNESLSLAGTGVSQNLGALASIYGVNSWAGPITLNKGVRLTTLQATDSLDLSGAIGGNGSATLEGAGTITYSGTTANTYTGNTRVNGGTLVLKKSIGNDAIPLNLYIGDGIGGGDADVVRLENANQIPNTTRVTIASSGLFEVNNVSELVGSLAGSGHVTLGNGVFSMGKDNSSTVFSGLIEGSGELCKYGTGTFELSGNNTYSGETKIYGGVLLVNGSQAGSDVVVGGSGTLGGVGTVGAISGVGTVAPGASAGQLGSGNVTWQSGSTFDVELDGHLPLNYDLLDARGAIALGNATLAVSWGFVPVVGDYFTILENDGTDAVGGTFNGLTNGATLVAGNVDVVVNYDGGTGNDVVLSVAAVRPLEPLTISSMEIVGGSLELAWTGGVPFYVVEKKTSLTNDTWEVVATTMREMHATVLTDTTNGFYRINGGN